MLKSKLKEVITSLLPTILRFPISIFFLLILTINLIIDIVTKTYFPDEQEFLLLFCPATAAFLNLILSIIGENINSKKQKLTLIISANVVWANYSFLASIYMLNEQHILGIVASCVVLLTIFFTYPSIRKSTDIACWKFSTYNIGTLIVTLVFGVILASGLSFLLLGAEMLFQFEAPFEIYAIIWIVVMTFITPIAYLTQIPNNEQIHNESNINSYSFGDKLTKYLLIPLQLLYMAFIYIYIFKIIIAWTLPNGYVSWLISISMLGMILLHLILYPKFLSEETESVQTKIIRYLPIAILPFLVLMSISIIRRLNDYGITIARLYLICLNIWFYGVCIYLIVRRSKRFVGIILSFSMLFFIASFGPLNIHNLTLRILKNDVKTLLANEKINYPIQKDDWNKLLKDKDNYTLYDNWKIDFSDFVTINDSTKIIKNDSINNRIMAINKLIYINRNYQTQQYADILNEDCYITYFETDTVIVAGENMPKYVEYNNRTYQNLPSGYQQFQILDNSYENCVIDLAQANCHVRLSNYLFRNDINETPIEADLNIKDIISAQNDSTQYIIKPNDSLCIIFSSIDINLKSQTISYSGILLKK